MIESFSVSYPAEQQLARRAHVGVAGSGDLELLLEPHFELRAEVSVKTRVAGHRKTWEAVLDRFFKRYPVAVRVEIRDGGATPGTVWLRLEQAVELASQAMEATYE